MSVACANFSTATRGKPIAVTPCAPLGPLPLLHRLLFPLYVLLFHRPKRHAFHRFARCTRSSKRTAHRVAPLRPLPARKRAHALSRQFPSHRKPLVHALLLPQLHQRFLAHHGPPLLRRPPTFCDRRRKTFRRSRHSPLCRRRRIGLFRHRPTHSSTQGQCLRRLPRGGRSH